MAEFGKKEMSDLEEAMRNALRRNPGWIPKYFEESKKLAVESGETDTRSPGEYLKDLGFDEPDEITVLLRQAGY